MKPLSTIVFDLETLPDGEYPTPEDVKVPGSMKKEETIYAFTHNPENLEQVYRDRSKSYIEGRILSIGWKADDDETIVHINGDEETVMQEFDIAIKTKFRERFDTDTIHSVKWIAHNLNTFDGPYLRLRAMKYNCEYILKAMGEKPDFVDTMKVACYPDYRGYVSLDALCKLFGLPGKGEIDGSMIYDMYKAGKIKEIADYCKSDVDKLYLVAQKLRLV